MIAAIIKDYYFRVCSQKTKTGLGLALLTKEHGRMHYCYCRFNILVQLDIQLINISLNNLSSDNNQLTLNHSSRHSHQCTTPLSITMWPWYVPLTVVLRVYH